MPSLGEVGTTGLSQFAAAAAAGVDTLALDQVITFDLYNRVVLSADGMVFWVKVTPTVVGQTQLSAKGSLHFATTLDQAEDKTVASNTIIFTSEGEINDLNNVAPGTMWIATYQGSANVTPLKIGFSTRGALFEQAQLWHYRGNALYTDMQTQVIDNPANVPSALIITNSLPIWLFLSLYVPSGPAYGYSNPFALYPSFLVPDNLNPVTTPYGSVEIGEGDTDALQSAPWIDIDQSHWQLAQDKVRITLYGGTNKQALDFVDCVIQYSVDYATMGIMNVPVIRDAKRPQVEFQAIAMKKLISFEVSYYQSNVVTVARQLIKKASESFIIKAA